MVQRARALWGPIWWLPALPWVAYAALVGALDQVRWEHMVVAAVVAALAYGGERCRKFYFEALPFFVLFIAYDALRYVMPISVTPSRVLGCSLDSTERALFGVRMGGAVLTPNELLGRLATPALDLICAVPYGAYLFVMLGHFAYLTRKCSEEARRFAWLALGTHTLGFITYQLLPAAPPWYVREHGCVIDFAIGNSPAALARVDALLGIDYFHGLYSHGSVAFGAMPSLHVTYPLYGLLVTYRSASLPSRVLQIAYAVTMPFAAVYLNHHYVLDVLLGFTYTLVVFAAVQRVLPVGKEAPEAVGSTALEPSRDSLDCPADRASAMSR
jgi:hypothetical protein